MTLPMFKEGDYFYMQETNEGGTVVYPVCYCLKIDHDHETAHISVFEDVVQPPSAKDIDQLETRIMHAPVALDGFQTPTVFHNRPVTEADLEEYNDYQQNSQDIDEEIIQEAVAHYERGVELHEQEKFEEAVNAYVDALETYPAIFEAADNAGFCCMSIGAYEKAIEFFGISEDINEPTFLTIFSTGECLLNMGNKEEAHQHLLKARMLSELDEEQRDALESFLQQTS